MSKQQYRTCAVESCKNRMPDLAYDGHIRCSTCIGQECNYELKCAECCDWSEEQFKAFVKHRHTLQVSRARKARYRKEKKTGSQVVSGGEQPPVTSAHNVSDSGSVEDSFASSVSPYSPSASIKPLLNTPTAASSSLDRDQVVKRTEFERLQRMMETFMSEFQEFVMSGQLKSLIKSIVEVQPLPLPRPLIRLKLP